jgi:hypothetical protein
MNIKHNRDTGRMLTALEIRSAQVYWHVKDVDSTGVGRIYPEGYKSHVVGMLWSSLAQMQTWFGSEAWKGQFNIILELFLPRFYFTTVELS